jgi:hypothetical protein
MVLLVMEWVMREKFLGVPSYKDRVITEGSIFHIVTYGINNGFSR